MRCSESKGENYMIAKVLIDNITKNELISEWGLAFYIEYEGQKFLLDTGASGNFAENAKSLEIHLGEIDYAVLSHAHYDHADGMPTFFGQNETAKFYHKTESIHTVSLFASLREESCLSSLPKQLLFA